MDKYTYKLTKKNKNINYATILKSGLSGEFSLAELGKNVRGWTKLRAELFSASAMGTAYVKNIETNYPKLMKMSDEELNAAKLYYEKKLAVADAQKDLKTIKSNITKYEKELPNIKKALGLTEDTDLDMALAEYAQQKDTAGEALKKALKNYGKKD